MVGMPEVVQCVVWCVCEVGQQLGCTTNTAQQMAKDLCNCEISRDLNKLVDLE